jgi:hypothetical protein
MIAELDKGLTVSAGETDAVDEFSSKLTNMVSLLAGADVNARFDYFNDFTLAVRAFGGVAVAELADELRMLNGECSRLMQAFKTAKGS